MSYLLAWMRNLLIYVLAFLGVCLFMWVFLRIFYPDLASFSIAIVKWTSEATTAFKLWPFIILMVIVSALPRRRR
jgi:hypothetical protein